MTLMGDATGAVGPQIHSPYLLPYDDITHYQRVVVAIKETIRLISEIDKAIPNGR